MVLKLQLEIIVRSIKEISQKYIRVQQKYSNTNMFKHCCNIMNVDLIHLKRTFQGFVMCFLSLVIRGGTGPILCQTLSGLIEFWTNMHGFS